MDSRQRVMRAVAHREPDRVPIDFWALSEVGARLRSHLGLPSQEDLLKYLHVDLRVIQGPSFVGQEMAARADGSVQDLWGVWRKPQAVGRAEVSGTYMEVSESPLAGATSVAEIEAYPGWPSPDSWDYSHVHQGCAECQGYAVVNAGDRKDRTAQLKPAMYLRGIEQFLADMQDDPAIAEAIIAKIVHYFLAYNRCVFEAARGKIDIFMMGDDFGMQQGPIVSPAMWRRYFSEGFRQFIDLAHSYGIKVMHHTCGSVRALIPDFIEAGLDVLQSIQPRAAGMDLAELKREFGRNLCFHGSIDIQRTLPFGTPDDVREEVRQRMQAGKPGGGFIIGPAHNIQFDTPTDNILAMYEACLEYGAY
jgi:uroporphyrinogen decarboxylase